MADKLYRARIVSSVAATLIALACGTNYVYSAWGPQFADKLKLSATESNLVGLSGNLGMYSFGIPIGMWIDAKGPRSSVIAGAVFLALGYYPLYLAFERGSGWLPLLCFYSYLSGLGGCAAFQGAIKTSALNWPHHRGTATGFPLAAFGLSAFFFSTLAAYALPGGTGQFLLLLSFGTSGLTLLSFFFMRVLPHSHYTSLSSKDRADGFASNGLLRVKPEDGNKRRNSSDETGMPKFPSDSSKNMSVNGIFLSPLVLNTRDVGAETPASGVFSPSSSTDVDETASLMSHKSSDDIDEEETNLKDHSHLVDIRGLRMIATVEFWQQFALMGILAGVGLMTINNIGNDAKALWRHYDDSVNEDFIIKRQALHVSILSIGSFAGRLMSGVGSDFLVKVLHASRIWSITVASLIFLLAQIAALSIQNPQFLYVVSSLTGIGYGILFGGFPSLVAEAFGVHGLATNWGFMTFAPVISGNVFNIFYGTIYDKHSIVEPSGERECTEGLDCYRSAYLVTIAACVLGLLVSLWSIRYTHVARLREEAEREAEERDA